MAITFYLCCLEHLLNAKIRTATPIKETNGKNKKVSIVQSDLTYGGAKYYIYSMMVKRLISQNSKVKVGEAYDGTILTLRKESTSNSGPTLDYNNNKGHIYKIRLRKL